MNHFYLYFLLSMFTGNPLMAIVLVILIYAFIDKMYFGFFPDATKAFRRNREIKNRLRELSFNEDNAQAAFSLGVLYFEKKKYQEALKYLEHPRLQEDHTASYYYYLGMTLMELKRAEEGTEFLTKALAVDPRVGYGLPYIYLIENEVRQTEPKWDRIHGFEEKVDSFGNAENLYRLGITYKRLGHKDKANTFFSKAITEYAYCPKGLRRLHRRWAILSRIHKGLNK